VVLFAIDKHGVFTLSEGKGLDALGLKPGQVVGQSVFDIYRDTPEVLQDIGRALTGEEFTNTVEVGELVFETHHSPLRDDSGSIAGLIGVSTDITERKRAEEAIRESEETLKSTIESTADGILVVNNAGQVVYANQRFGDMWRIPSSLLETRDDEKLLEYVLSQLQEPKAFLAKVKELYESSREDLDTLDFKDGRAFERYSRPLMMGDRVAGRVWSFRDVTERKRAERTLAEQARRDPLTGLLNRRAGLAAINERLAAARSDNDRLALFVLDLDKFKSINDSYSHEMGDAALVRLSAVLTKLVGDAGVICRLGGDEFEIALAGVGIEDAIDFGEQLRSSLHRSLTRNRSQRLPIFTASFGIACYPEDGESAIELGRRADEAMYAGKAAGGDAVRAWRLLASRRAA
jgi:diguanylate cyclase (GGDEF)-like protein/PAS domain S-box-containing protein